MSLLPKSIHRCRRYPTKFNSGRDIPVNTGYHDIFNGHVTEVNGQKVKNLRHLVEADADEPFVAFKGNNHSVVVLDREKAELENPKILETYGISADRSEDLR